MTDDLAKKLANYKTPEQTIDLIHDTQVVFLVGVSGAGKDTILKELLKTGKYSLIISHTTRPPRANHGLIEQDGKDYHFVDFDEVASMLENNEFVEAKHYSGNVYGTSVAEISKAHDEGKIAISDIEVQGVEEYRTISRKVIPIFILPPDFETWQTRLKNRYLNGIVDTEDLNKRLQTAKTELEDALTKNYFQYVVNQDLGTAVKVVDKIAHGNFSARKNQQAKKIAQNLTEKLQNYI